MSTTATPRRPSPRLPFRRRTPAPQYPVQIRPDGSRDVELPLREHLRELRDRLIKAVLFVVVATGLSLTFAEQEVQLLVRLAYPHQLIAVSPTETFVSYLKVAFITGLAVSMPVLVYQLFRFLAPGLTRTERSWILISLPGITFFFVAGVLFFYFLALRSALS